MAAFIGRTVNKNTAAVQAEIALNSSSSTKIVDINLQRIFLRIDNVGNQAVHIKLQAASVDNVKVGIYIASGGFWEMPTDTIYTGEISGIAASDGPDVHYTEY